METIYYIGGGIIILVVIIYFFSKATGYDIIDYRSLAMLDDYQLRVDGTCTTGMCISQIYENGSVGCFNCTANITGGIGGGNTSQEMINAINITQVFQFTARNTSQIPSSANRSYVLRMGDDMNGTLIINTTNSQLMGLLGEAPSDWTNVPLVLQPQNGRDFIQLYNSSGSNVGYIDSTGVAYLQGINLGLIASKNYVSKASGYKLSNYWIPRDADLTNIVQLDYQDELAYRHLIANSITISPTSNASNTINNTFIDDSTTLAYASGTTFNPFSVTINTNSSPITNKASASWRLGLTFRSSTTTAIPIRFTVETDVSDNGTYFLVLNNSVLGYGSVFDTYLSPTFQTPTPFNIYKMRINMTFASNPVVGIFRLQRLMLYHQTSGWDNFHVSKSGDSMYGNLLGGVNNSYDLGSSTNMWNDLYVGGTIYGGSPVLFKDSICMWDRGLKTYVECYPENLKIICEESKECNEKFERSEALNLLQKQQEDFERLKEMQGT